MCDTTHPKVLRGRRIVCATTGGVHFERAEVGTFQFVDYSWDCIACGGRHCSECCYETDGVTVTVTDCGRFGMPEEELRGHE